MITSKWFRFIIAKIYNILRYVIPHKLRHMFIKETEISQKGSKGIKNWKINLLCYFKCSLKQNKLDFRVQFSFNGSATLLNANCLQISKDMHKCDLSKIGNLIGFTFNQSSTIIIYTMSYYSSPGCPQKLLTIAVVSLHTSKDGGPAIPS